MLRCKVFISLHTYLPAKATVPLVRPKKTTGHKSLPIETFSTTFFVFTADVELRFDVWRLRLEVRSFFYFSKALHRQVKTGRNARNSG